MAIRVPYDLANALFDFSHTTMTGVPAAVKRRIRNSFRPHVSIDGGVANFAEVIYAARAEVPPAVVDLGIEAALSGHRHGIASLSVDDRGRRMAREMRKIAGVTQVAEENAAAPEPAGLEGL